MTHLSQRAESVFVANKTAHCQRPSSSRPRFLAAACDGREQCVFGTYRDGQQVRRQGGAALKEQQPRLKQTHTHTPRARGHRVHQLSSATRSQQPHFGRRSFMELAGN